MREKATPKNRTNPASSAVWLCHRSHPAETQRRSFSTFAWRSTLLINQVVDGNHGHKTSVGGVNISAIEQPLNRFSHCNEQDTIISMADVTKEGTSPSFYDDEENLKRLCDFLRSRDGPAVREALLMEKRVYYLKGKSLARVSV